MKKSRWPFTKDDLLAFKRDGFLYVEDFLPPDGVLRLQQDIHRLIGMFLEREGLRDAQVPFSPPEFDSGLPALLKKSRRLGAEVYEAVKKLQSHVRLASDDRHVDATNALLGTEFSGFASRGWGLRLDHPAEDNFLTQLHQDYISQLCSPRGVVYWTPLRDVDAATGPVIIYPGSHHAGVFPIEVTGEGSQGLNIHDEPSVLSRFEAICPEVKAGDCVMIDMLLLHKSSANRSARTRWALISRYFDFCEPVGRKIGWIGGLQDGHSFEKVFPELTVNVAGGQSNG